MNFVSNLKQGYFQIFLEFYHKKPDLVVLILFLCFYLVLFLFVRLFFKKRKRSKKSPPRKKDKGVGREMGAYHEDNIKLNLYDYTVRLVYEAIGIIRTKKKMEKGDGFKVDFSQAMSMFSNPKFLFYLSENKKIMFERMPKEASEIILSSTEERLTRPQRKKEKEIELEDGVRVTLDENSLIRKVFSPELENKKIASQLDSEIKGEDLDSILDGPEPKKTIEEKDGLLKKEQEEKEIERVAENFFTSFSKTQDHTPKEKKPMNAVEYKKKIKQKKNEKENLRDLPFVEISDLQKITDEILSENTQALESRNEKKEEVAQQDPRSFETKEKLKTAQGSESKQESGVLTFIKTEVLCYNYVDQIFIIEDNIIFRQRFFNNFRFANPEDEISVDALKIILGKFEKKYQISFQINKSVHSFKNERFTLLAIPKEVQAKIESLLGVSAEE
ncbi:hypothetical protein BKH46_08570 [Helicobacter sp. 12S02634-8]|uniref:hypothetical protein n=1 Tax=Helicobacter sp. 12S02634-8 TaxID=1476199 RepID=UPI000BA5DB8C|nr:hypothetical protein [Helicobacter sp. 12S02634-8]PAF46180.1 hypothetical protein BKH46_08570 [Helicobacter sp. 12S02634-8]